MAVTLCNVLNTPTGAIKTKILTVHATNTFRVVQQPVATKIFVVHSGQTQTAMIVI